MVLTVSVIYGMCWMPNLTIYALNYFSPSQNYGDVTYITSIVLVTCNSTVNPFIYVFVSQKFRRKIKNLVCCSKCCSNRVGISNESTNHTTDHTNTITPPTAQEDVGVGGESNRPPTALLDWQWKHITKVKSRISLCVLNLLVNTENRVSWVEQFFSGITRRYVAPSHERDRRSWLNQFNHHPDQDKNIHSSCLRLCVVCKYM